MYPEDDFIQLSALQHYAYCPRQCALIHMEMAWAENQATAEGRLLHERADSGKVEVRGDLKIVAGLLLRSTVLGVSGKADVVEFHREGSVWRSFPVEYKRGRSKSSDVDRVQLCAQAMCLEEMLGRDVRDGALFYGQSRRREQVFFSGELRENTARVARSAHDLLSQKRLPAPANDARCPGCSLLEQCRPKDAAGRSAFRYLESLRAGP
ncbi:MAG: CRISPR-associated protein Cas4 [Desulfovibrio sp.]|nr:CRISPR-associated protein Cas4 [Desulfovibrio sp.]